MEVVVLLVAIVGVALIVIPRLQRRKAGSHRPSKPRRRASTPVVAAAAVPAASAAAWAPPEPAGLDSDAWDDDLGWEGEAEPAPEAREAWEDWRAAARPSAGAADASAPEPEIEELPSVERWRARTEDDDWVEEDDDGLGWEGADEPPPPPALWNGNGNGHAPAPPGPDAGLEGGRDWSRTPAPERERLLNAAADLLDERAPAIAQTMVEECGGTFGWGMFNCMLASGMLRAAGALADRVDGAVEEIESGVPGLNAKAVRQPAGVVVGWRRGTRR